MIDPVKNSLDRTYLTQYHRGYSRWEQHLCNCVSVSCLPLEFKMFIHNPVPSFSRVPNYTSCYRMALQALWNFPRFKNKSRMGTSWADGVSRCCKAEMQQPGSESNPNPLCWVSAASLSPGFPVRSPLSNKGKRPK